MKSQGKQTKGDRMREGRKTGQKVAAKQKQKIPKENKTKTSH